MSARWHRVSKYCSFVSSMSCRALSCSSASVNSPSLSKASADRHRYSRCLRVFPDLIASRNCDSRPDLMCVPKDDLKLQLTILYLLCFCSSVLTSCSKVCCDSATSPLAICSSAKPSHAGRLALSDTIADRYSAFPLLTSPRQYAALPARLQPPQASDKTEVWLFESSS